MKTSRKLIATLLFAGSAPLHAAPASHASVAKPYTTLATSELLDFRYSFPTIVGTYPALLAKIRGDQDGQYREALDTAQADLEARKGQDFPFHQHEFWRDWTVAGNAFPLLSLQSHVDDFTGGAHGNHYSSAMLWDEKRDTQVDLDGLFGGSAKLWKQIQPEYCRKLDEERRRRKTDSVGCPELKDLTIVPDDSDFNFAFDSLRIIADPYVAGSYAEGAYVISLPVTATMLESIEPDYRGAFEAQRQ
ncbi:MAG TPA: DUF4163 domain-containing protein [Sphingomicrobium sp.]|nr:DUF4163 domain-containing protein [Sphingomicrobium sp.]